MNEYRVVVPDQEPVLHFFSMEEAREAAKLYGGVIEPVKPNPEQLPSGRWRAVKRTSNAMNIRVFDSEEEAIEYVQHERSD